MIGLPYMTSSAGSVSMHLQNETGNCPNCGSVSRVGRGLCLNCLLSSGIDTNGEHAPDEPTLDELLGKISERESIAPTRDEVDREVERIARQQREPLAAARFRMEKDGSLNRIASHIQTEKTLNFLFEHSRKVAEEPEPDTPEAIEAGAEQSS